MRTDIYKNKTIVVTGGSSGIGLALSNEFAKQGANIVLIARDEIKLASAKLKLEAAGNTSSVIETISADVADKEKITSVIQLVGNEHKQIDVLINCAGITSCGRLADQSNADIDRCMQVNYLGALYTSKAAWPYLKAAKGQLSFVSSVAGYIGLIGYSSYAPTKFALTGLAECLRMEGEDDGIRVSVIYPPDTDTPMLQYEHEHTLPDCRALSKNIKVKSAEEVAVKYLRGLAKNKFNIYCDGSSRLLRWFKNNFPALAYYTSKQIVNKDRKKRKQNDSK